ncbi:MAG: hypothetical protein KA191_18080 [Verrucomicrobia bacterium]|jgi:hypothetical protein|nr:hypothetical protein [Verrucomicrobiota bacterium]
MSILATTHPTLLDLKNTWGPDNKVGMIAELLSQNNEVLDDMVWVEGNLPTGHVSNIRTGLPAPTWRKLYGGVQPTKSTSRKVTDACGMLEAYAEVDKALADLNGNSAAFRLSEDRAHMEGMSQELAASLFYANEATAPEEITGFAPRFNDQSALNGENILTDAATPDNSDNSSIWLVGWGPYTCFGIYPKGSMGGLQMSDKGQVTIESIDGAGGRMEAYRTHYRWDSGLVVKDWRYVIRIQVDQENIVKDAATGPDLIDLMTQACEMVPSDFLSVTRPAFYMNRTLRSFLRRQVVNKVKNSTLTMQDVAGKRALTFDDIPIRRCDVLTNTETGI